MRWVFTITALYYAILSDTSQHIQQNAINVMRDAWMVVGTLRRAVTHSTVQYSVGFRCRSTQPTMRER